jgi:hypothetical protein
MSTQKLLKPSLKDFSRGDGETVKPSLVDYIKGMGTPKYCPMCGKKIKVTLYDATQSGVHYFPFWDFTCFKCDFAGEIEPDVPIGATQ